MYAYSFRDYKPLRPFEKSIEMRHEIILIMSIDETFPAVVYEPAGNVRSEHDIRPVVLLHASAKKMCVGLERRRRSNRAWLGTALLLFLVPFLLFLPSL